MNVRTLTIPVAVLASWIQLSAQSASAPTGPFVEVLGHQIHYVEAGNGPPVVLIHGLGADTRAWRQVIPALATKFHVYAIDQIGAGQSDKPQMPYRVGVLADHVAGFVRAMGLPHATLIGHSLGGWTAALVAAREPALVDRLVLMDAAGYHADTADLVNDALSNVDPTAASMAQRFLGSANPDDQQMAQSVVGMYFQQRFRRDDGYALAAIVGSLLRREDVLTDDEVHAIKAPTLVIWGGRDEVISPDTGAAWASAIPGATLVTLDGCSHRVQLQCADRTNQAILKFLSPN